MYFATARRSDGVVIAIEESQLRDDIPVEKWPQAPDGCVWVLTTKSIYEQVQPTLRQEDGHYNWKVQHHNGVWEFLVNPKQQRPIHPEKEWFAFVRPDRSIALVWESHRGRMPVTPEGTVKVKITEEQFKQIDTQPQEAHHI